MITVRDMLPRDRKFVVPTWVFSFADVAPWAKRLARESHWKVVDRIIDDGVRVVVLSTESGALHGWACATGETLHYVYMPPELRGRGLARKAIASVLGGYPASIEVSHPWPRASRRFRWNPYSLFVCEQARKAA